MDIALTGRPMKGFVYVAGPHGGTDERLERWLQLARAFVETLPPK